MRSKGIYPSFGAITALPLSLLQVKSCCWKHVQAVPRESSDTILAFVGNSCCLAMVLWLKSGHFTQTAWWPLGKVGTLTPSHGTGHVTAPSQKTCFQDFKRVTLLNRCLREESSLPLHIGLHLVGLCSNTKPSWWKSLQFQRVAPLLFFPKILDMSLSKPSLHH